MQTPPDTRRNVWICLSLAVVTLAVYGQALHNQFLTFDDQAYVTENRHVLAGLTFEDIGWAFRSVTAGNWHPLTMLSHMLDCQIYGLRPWGHHLTSILLHTANTVLLFLAFARMTGAVWRSAFVAALFAVHPAHVESVAWVAERKDVLCGFFYLLAIWAYLEAQISRSKCRYAWVTILFALALMSKPMAVTLPFVLLLLDCWPLGRARGLDWRSWGRLAVEKWPLLLLSGVWCGITVWAQHHDQAVASAVELPLSGRLAHAVISYLNYVRVLVFPWHLSAYYPYQHHESLVWGAVAAVALALVTWLAVALAPRRPYGVVGWLWFLGTLVPVIGLVQVGGQGWADRYVYLPSIGFFVVVVWGVGECVARHPAVKLFIPVVGVALVWVTSVELRYWKDTRTLFGRAMAVTENNYLAMTLAGSMDADTGKLDDAILLYRQALAFKPIYPEAHFFLGRALEGKGQPAEALSEYNQALRLRPDFDAAHVMVGLLLIKERKYDQAVTHFQAALKTNPESAPAQSDWGMALTKQGRWQESIGHYEQALRLDPTLAEAHNNLGIDYLQTGRLADGVRELRVTLQLNPGDTETAFNLAQALNQQGQWGQAAELLKPLALATSANFNAQFQYGLALEHLGQTRDAMSHYAAALLKNPNFPDALQHMAWIAATDAQPELRNGGHAVEMAARACELTGQKRPGMLLTLGAAYAEAGRFGEALATVKKADELAKAQGQREIETEAGRLRASFEAGQPFHGQSK
jgi:tetratricopeptide (TPR) repeat protein